VLEIKKLEDELTKYQQNEKQIIKLKKKFDGKLS
jgi:hypothetical protein